MGLGRGRTHGAVGPVASALDPHLPGTRLHPFFAGVGCGLEDYDTMSRMIDTRLAVGRTPEIAGRSLLGHPPGRGREARISAETGDRGIGSYMMPEDQSRTDRSPSPRAATGGASSLPGHDRSERTADTNGQRPSQAWGRGVQVEPANEDSDPGWVIETIYSPFHCLYQDALFFHTQSRLARSDSEASRLARSALLLYLSSAEALVHQAAEELGRPELRGLIADPSRPLPLAEAWRLLPAIVAEPGVPTGPFDPERRPGRNSSSS